MTILLISCSENKTENKRLGADETNELAAKFGLTPFEYENGVGPIKSKINFKSLDLEKAKLGRKIYNNKCTTCHKLEKRFVAPPLIPAVRNRTPEFILNMILNPEEMVKRHPEMMKQFAIYAKQMTDFNFEIEEAMNILHYLIYESEQKNDE